LWQHVILGNVDADGGKAMLADISGAR